MLTISPLTNGYVETGIRALIDDIRTEDRINVLSFPDMRYLLAWSREPVLGEGISLVVGGHRQMMVLSGLLCPKQVLLLDNQMSLSMVRSCLQHRLERQVVPEIEEPTPSRHQIRISDDELKVACRMLLGFPGELGNKRDSQLKLRLMRKIGAGDRASFLVRLRLLFWLDRRFLCQEPVFRAKGGR